MSSSKYYTKLRLRKIRNTVLRTGPTPKNPGAGTLFKSLDYYRRGQIYIALEDGDSPLARAVLSKKLDPLPANQRNGCRMELNRRACDGNQRWEIYTPRSEWEQALAEFWADPRLKQRDLDKFIKEGYDRSNS